MMKNCACLVLMLEFCFLIMHAIFLRGNLYFTIIVWETFNSLLGLKVNNNAIGSECMLVYERETEKDTKRERETCKQRSRGRCM